MPQDREDIRPLIQEIRTLSVTDKAKAGTVALLSVIPYAGGAVASVIGEIATKRKFEKVCDILSDLHANLESHQADPEHHLSKDQIIEAVHETLQTAATASDERKIAALKNGLAYVFLADDSFERKQLLLQILRNCTSLELAVLAALYDVSDPYIVQEGHTPVEPEAPQYGIATAASSLFLRPQGEWRPVRNESDCGQPTLLKFLAESTHFDEGATEGALRLLDGKGLANAGPNLHRSDCKVLQWTPTPSGVYAMTVSTVSFDTFSGTKVEATPLEASRTQFGRDFLRFCRHS